MTEEEKEEKHMDNVMELMNVIDGTIDKLIIIEYHKGFDDGVKFMQKKYPELLNEA